MSCATRLRIRGVRPQATVTKRRRCRRRGRSGAQARPRSSPGARQQLATATSETALAAQNTAAKPKRSLSAPPATPPSTPGGAVAEHRVQRLAAAAQPPREVAREDARRRPSAGRRKSGRAAAGPRPAPPPGSAKAAIAAKRSADTRGRQGQPAVHRQPLDPAALEREPGHLDRHCRPTRAGRSPPCRSRARPDRANRRRRGWCAPAR